MELLLALGWLAAAIGAGAIASSKGRSGFGYFLFGLLLPLIGLLVAIGMAPLSPAAGVRHGGDLILCQKCGRPHRADAPICPKCGKMNLGPSEPAMKKCPACAEAILAEAKKCKHCGEIIATTVAVEVRRPSLPDGVEAKIVAALKAGGDPDEEWMRGTKSDGGVRMMPWDGSFKSVSGETFKNPDGVSRQTILSHAEPGAGVYLVAEPTNQHDPDAVAVYLDAGGGDTAQIGYLPRDHGMSGDIASGSVLAWLARVAQRNPTAPIGAALYVVVRNGPAPVATNATPPARAPSGGLGVSGCIAVVVVVGGTLYFYAFDVFVPKQASEASNWSAPAPRAAADPYDQTGCSASKRAIGDKLKSPGSAKWVSCQVTTEAGVQNVRLVVDSQNASGGLVRTEWMTKVRDNNVESVDQFR